MFKANRDLWGNVVVVVRKASVIGKEWSMDGNELDKDVMLSLSAQDALLLFPFGSRRRSDARSMTAAFNHDSRFNTHEDNEAGHQQEGGSGTKRNRARTRTRPELCH
jgi:hypothetical protein